VVEAFCVLLLLSLLTSWDIIRNREGVELIFTFWRIVRVILIRMIKKIKIKIIIIIVLLL
jgi:hypothetical protein